MFTVQPKPTFTLDVEIPTPNGPVEIRGTFKHKGRKAMAEFLEGLSKGETTDVEALMDLMVGWEKVDTPFSAEALEQVLDNYPTFGKAILDAYIAATLEGRQVEKNSVKS